MQWFARTSFQTTFQRQLPSPTCFNSTDGLIVEVCGILFNRYNKDWTAIPKLREELVLNNTQYWVAVGYR